MLKCINGIKQTDFNSDCITDDLNRVKKEHIISAFSNSLHLFLQGLCYEYISSGSDKNHYQVDRYGQLGLFRKNFLYNCRVSSDNGFSCVFPKQINKQSFIQMAFFAMETCGAIYSYEILSQ